MTKSRRNLDSSTRDLRCYSTSQPTSPPQTKKMPLNLYGFFLSQSRILARLRESMPTFSGKISTSPSRRQLFPTLSRVGEVHYLFMAEIISPFLVLRAMYRAILIGINDYKQQLRAAILAYAEEKENPHPGIVIDRSLSLFNQFLSQIVDSLWKTSTKTIPLHRRLLTTQNFFQTRSLQTLTPS